MTLADQERIIRLEQRVEKTERILRRLRDALAEVRYRTDAVGVIAESMDPRRKGKLL